MMKRITFLKSLLGLPFFGHELAQKLTSREKGPQYLLNKFYVAGFQYYSGPTFINQMQRGEELQLNAKSYNEYDRFAVEIWRNGTMLGHVPRTENKHISRLLQQKVDLYCFVSEVNPERETWKMLQVEIYL